MATHLITGAGSGIGRIVAQRLLQRGDDVWLLARSDQRASEMAADHEGAVILVADLAHPSELDSLSGSLPEALDSLVHAAGIVELGEAADLSATVWQEQLAVNLISPAILTKVALPALRVRGGTVVMVNSGAGLHAHPLWSAYAASKHGLRALADSLRAEEQPNRVRVTSVYPGRTATPMQAKVHEQEGKDYDPGDWIDPATVADSILTVLDLPGEATISDLTIRPR